VIGIVVLAQLPSVVEVIGVALVVLGVAVHRDREDPPGRAKAASITEPPRCAKTASIRDGEARP
jgi:inner membrane transporter RhtA